ncbi:uncharacterized protein LOC127878123 [Dreissena polymorpha]|uniref:uncharacterized protein LOC127878123 n=1 Tax=Dreissena polymorpha TaxID=45954 RepID=UPI0022654C02|nr:uncharacterized protein LOC127878123 [Dreissena polymorpha]XP_052280507.1 uncharacterized protein LOC127878123 [Dreissena polymorpha]
MVTRPDILAEAFRELNDNWDPIEKKRWQQEDERRYQEDQRRSKEEERRQQENERMRQDRVNLAWNYTKKGRRRLEDECRRLVEQRRQGKKIQYYITDRYYNHAIIKCTHKHLHLIVKCNEIPFLTSLFSSTLIEMR